MTVEVPPEAFPVLVGALFGFLLMQSLLVGFALGAPLLMVLR